MAHVIERTLARATEQHRNQQNYVMAVNHEKSFRAMLALMLLDITILDVRISGSAPLIDVMASPEVECLEARRYALLTKSADQNGERKSVMRAHVEGCIVQWPAPVLN
mgnify:CR=1 FL=1